MRHLHHAAPATESSSVAIVVDPSEHWPTSQLEYSDLMAGYGHALAENHRLRDEITRLELIITGLQP